MEAVEPWGVLVVAQSEAVHEEIVALLQTARRARQKGAFAEAMPMGHAGFPGHPGLTGTAPEAAGATELRLYPVFDSDPDQIVQIIRALVAKDTWAPQSHQGEVFPVNGRLLVRQTPAVHAEIEELPDALRRANKAGPFGMPGMGGAAWWKA